MIFDSEFWKRDLVSIAKKLEKLKQYSCWNEIDYFRFEKLIMIGFYSIRKLKDAGKLSNSTTSSKIEICQLQTKGIIVHIHNAYKYEDYYDFENPIVVKRDLAFFLNQIIHSYVFSPFFENNNIGESTLKGIHFNSDDNRNICLFEMSIETLIIIFNTAGKDYPAYSEFKYDEKKKDYRIFNANTQPSNRKKSQL